MWKDIVSGGNPQAISEITFIEFMGKLDREVAHRKEQAKKAEEQAAKMKRNHKY